MGVALVRDWWHLPALAMCRFVESHLIDSLGAVDDLIDG